MIGWFFIFLLTLVLVWWNQNKFWLIFINVVDVCRHCPFFRLTYSTWVWFLQTKSYIFQVYPIFILSIYFALHTFVSYFLNLFSKNKRLFIFSFRVQNKPKRNWYKQWSKQQTRSSLSSSFFVKETKKLAFTLHKSMRIDHDRLFVFKSKRLRSVLNSRRSVLREKRFPRLIWCESK